MLRRAFVISFLLIASPALADEQQQQQQFLSKALAGLQQQRNDAMDNVVNETAKSALLREQLKEAQAALAEMSAWIEAAKPKIPEGPK